MISTFTATVVGNHSLGSSYDRYYQETLAIASGAVIPAGAQINSVTLRCSNITVWSSNVISGAHIRLDGVDFTPAQWTPRGDNKNILKECYATASIYAGKNSFVFWCGWDNTPTSTWCSFRNGGVLTLTIDWNAASTITPDASTVTAGQQVGITINRASSSYKHTVVYSIGSHTHTVQDVATRNTYTIPEGWCDALPYDTSGTLLVSVTTYNGDTALGTTTANITLQVPATAVPSAGTLNLGATGLLDGYYVQGKTSINPSTSGATGALGSLIVGIAYNKTGLLNESGDITVTATVTDSRRRTGTVSTTVHVYPYAKPTLTGVEVFRCDSDGNEDDEGTYLSVKATGGSTAIPTAGTNVNPVRLLRFSVAENGGSYGTEVILTSGVASVCGTVQTDKAYTVKLRVADELDQTEMVVQISTSGYLLYLKKDGTGAAFGKACEHSNALEVPATWDFYQGSHKLVDLIYPVGSIYMSVVNVSPATLIGGTWERIQDTFLLAAGSSHAAGTTGGSETHTPGGTVGSHTLTVNEMPSHNHTQSGHTWNWGGNQQTLYVRNSSVATISKGTQVPDNDLSAQQGVKGYASTNDSGGGAGHNHGFTGTSQNTMPPYLTVYMWKRTA